MGTPYPTSSEAEVTGPSFLTLEPSEKAESIGIQQTGKENKGRIKVNVERLLDIITQKIQALAFVNPKIAVSLYNELEAIKLNINSTDAVLYHIYWYLRKLLAAENEIDKQTLKKLLITTKEFEEVFQI